MPSTPTPAAPAPAPSLSADELHDGYTAVTPVSPMDTQPHEPLPSPTDFASSYDIGWEIRHYTNFNYHIRKQHPKEVQFVSEVEYFASQDAKVFPEVEELVPYGTGEVIWGRFSG